MSITRLYSYPCISSFQLPYTFHIYLHCMNHAFKPSVFYFIENPRKKQEQNAYFSLFFLQNHRKYFRFFCFTAVDIYYLYGCYAFFLYPTGNFHFFRKKYPAVCHSDCHWECTENRVVHVVYLLCTIVIRLPVCSSG